MEVYRNVVQDKNGNVISGATVTVYDVYGNKASLFADKDGNVQKLNPFTSDAAGTFSFAAADGTYQVVIDGISKGKRFNQEYFIILFDPNSGSLFSSNPADLDKGIRWRDILGIEVFNSLFQRVPQYFEATDGQVDFTLSNPVSNILAIAVYVNGERLNYQSGDYVLTDPTTLTLAESYPAGSEVLVFYDTLDSVTSLSSNIPELGKAVVWDVAAFTVSDYAELQTLLPLSRITANVLGRDSDRLGGGIFVWQNTDLSAEVASDPQMGIYVPPNSDPTGASGAWVRQYEGGVNVEWFGAKGDGVTDDSAALSACFSYAKTVGLAVKCGGSTYGIKAPVIIPDGLRLEGPSPTTTQGVMTIKVLPGFSSTYTMFYSDGAITQTYNIAAALIGESWLNNSAQGLPVYLKNFLVDVDSNYDDRGAVIHGAILNNMASDLEFGVYNTTGHGIWINSQRPDGSASGTIVSNKFMNNRIGNINVNSDTYNINGTHYYNAIHCGQLEGAREAGTHANISAKVTDGKIFQTVITEACHGRGVFIADGGGWQISKMHTNFTDLDGIYIERANNAIITENFVDGACNAAPTGCGYVGGITIKGIFASTGSERNGCIVANNVITLRNKNGTFNTDGTVTFVPIDTASDGAGAEITLIGNRYSLGSDATTTEAGYVVAFRPLASGGVMRIYSNDYQIDGYSKLFAYAASSTIEQSNNSWQFRTISEGKPTTGWHPTGMRIAVVDPGNNNPTGYVCTASGTPGSWKAEIVVGRHGNTASRPTLDMNDVGFMYWDTDLDKPIWWTGSTWKTFNVNTISV